MTNFRKVYEVEKEIMKTFLINVVKTSGVQASESDNKTSFSQNPLCLYSYVNNDFTIMTALTLHSLPAKLL